MPPYTAVPGSASWLLGLANHENQPLPLVDVRQFLLKGPPASALSSAIVVECAHGKVLLAVEKIITLVDLAAKPRNALLPDCCTTEYVEYVCEHDDSAVVVVQLASLITAVERAALESTASSGELA